MTAIPILTYVPSYSTVFCHHLLLLSVTVIMVKRYTNAISCTICANRQIEYVNAQISVESSTALALVDALVTNSRALFTGRTKLLTSL